MLSSRFHDFPWTVRLDLTRSLFDYRWERGISFRILGASRLIRIFKGVGRGGWEIREGWSELRLMMVLYVEILENLEYFEM